MLASTMNDCCQSVSRKLNGYIIGTENCIDMISFMCSLQPKHIARYLLANVHFLSVTKELYKRDLIHKLILEVLGIHSLSHVGYSQSLSAEMILAKIVDAYPTLSRQLNITAETISEIVRIVHAKSFFNKPIVKI